MGGAQLPVRPSPGGQHGVGAARGRLRQAVAALESCPS